jgi:uncharacterized membrane protein YGL010W
MHRQVQLPPYKLPHIALLLIVFCAILFTGVFLKFGLTVLKVDCESVVNLVRFVQVQLTGRFQNSTLRHELALVSINL